MSLPAILAAAAGLAALALAAPAVARAEPAVSALAQHHGDSRAHHHRRERWDPGFGRGHGRWNGPEGYFVVHARACPDLREDLRDHRRARTYRHNRRGYEPHHRGYGRPDWRDRRVLQCPSRAWDYVPSRREARAGRDGRRLHPGVAYWDARTNRYYVETRWGAAPVHVDWGRHGYRYDRH
ncbi:MAG: hypothetical protein ACLFQ5_12625, partial [Oceanicaulis sp.]